MKLWPFKDVDQISQISQTKHIFGKFLQMLGKNHSEVIWVCIFQFFIKSTISPEYF